MASCASQVAIGTEVCRASRSQKVARKSSGECECAELKVGELEVLLAKMEEANQSAVLFRTSSTKYSLTISSVSLLPPSCLLVDDATKGQVSAFSIDPGGLFRGGEYTKSKIEATSCKSVFDDCKHSKSLC